MQVTETTSTEIDPEKEAVQVLDWQRLGQALIEMIVNSDRPVSDDGKPIETGDIKILEDYLNEKAGGGAPAVKFPKRVETFRIEQSSWREFVLRLPAPKLGEAGRDRVCKTGGNDIEYKEPPFYKEKLCRTNPTISNCEFFQCRVADYTMSMCK